MHISCIQNRHFLKRHFFMCYLHFFLSRSKLQECSYYDACEISILSSQLWVTKPGTGIFLKCDHIPYLSQSYLHSNTFDPLQTLEILLSNYIRIKDVLVCDGNDRFLHIVIDKYSEVLQQIIG